MTKKETAKRVRPARYLRGITGFLAFFRKLRFKAATEGLTDVMDELDREEEQEPEHSVASKHSHETIRI